MINYRDYSKKWERIFVGKNFTEGYSGIYKDKDWINKIISPVTSLINLWPVTKDIFIADIGCGSGILGLSLLKRLITERPNTFLHSIDVNANQLDGLENEAKKLGINLQYQAVNSNLFNIAYPNCFFMGIVGRLFLHHLTRDDNNRFWQFIVDKLVHGGIATIYSIVAPNKSTACFIRAVYEWRAKKLKVSPQGFLPTNNYIKKNLLAIKNIVFELNAETRGPLFVAGKGSIQEKVGLKNSEMAELEQIFNSAPQVIKHTCKIEKIKNADMFSEKTVATHAFSWPCQLITIRKE